MGLVLPLTLWLALATGAGLVRIARAVTGEVEATLPGRLPPLRDQEPRHTTNLHFGEWATVFPNAACATAHIDRIVHHADVIAIERKSFRRREAEDSKAKRSRK